MTKNPEQIEVAEIFERLENDHGLSKADVGRELMIERGYVGYLVTGKRNPSLRTLEQFRGLERKYVARAEGTSTEPPSADLDAVIRSLKLLEIKDKSKFNVVKTMVQSISPVPSSVVKHKSAKLLKKASASARRGG